MQKTARGLSSKMYKFVSSMKHIQMQCTGTSANAAHHTETEILKSVFSGGMVKTSVEINSVLFQEERIAYHWHNCHQYCTGIKKTACDLQTEQISI